MKQEKREGYQKAHRTRCAFYMARNGEAEEKRRGLLKGVETSVVHAGRRCCFVSQHLSFLSHPLTVTSPRCDASTKRATVPHTVVVVDEIKGDGCTR